MRSAICVSAILICASTVAQDNEYEIWPGATSFTSRGNIGTGTGETLQGFHVGSHNGFGSATMGILGVRSLSQDQDRTTQETFDTVIRSGDDVNGPDVNATELGVVVGSTTPMTTGTGAVAWRLTQTFSAAVQVPTDGAFFVGHRLPASPLWSMDGQSTHSTAMALHVSGAQQEDHGWQVITTSGTPVVSHPSQRRSWRYAIFTDSPTVQVAVDDAGTPRYGYGGLFPNSGNASVSVRVRDALNANGQAVVLIGLRSAASLPLPFTAGDFWLNPVSIVAALNATLDASGEAALPIGAVPAAFAGGQATIQALTISATGLSWSNAETVRG